MDKSIEIAAATSVQHLMFDYDNRLQRYTGQPMKLLRELVTLIKVLQKSA